MAAYVSRFFIFFVISSIFLPSLAATTQEEHSVRVCFIDRGGFENDTLTVKTVKKTGVEKIYPLFPIPRGIKVYQRQNCWNEEKLTTVLIYVNEVYFAEAEISEEDIKKRGFLTIEVAKENKSMSVSFSTLPSSLDKNR